VPDEMKSFSGRGLREQRKKNGFGKNNDKLNKSRKVGISSFAAFVVS